MMSPVSLVDQEELPGPGAESGGVGMVEEAAMQGTPSIAAAPDVLSSGSMAPPVVGPSGTSRILLSMRCSPPSSAQS